jgi:pimeloyl-ACP methyl ester carboxylesterase
MTTSYFGCGAARIAYDVQGEGPPVVCLTGMGELRSVYRYLTPALVAAGYRVAAMDLRGHGDSDDGFEAYDDVAQAEDALALIAALGGGPALLVGNSMGAAAAVWAAAEQPAKVAGLALLGPAVRDPKVNPLMALATRLMLVRPWGPSAWLAYHRRLHPGRQDERLAEHQREIRQAMRRGWPDPAAEARFIAGALSADVLMVPDAGHYPQAEYPERVNPAVVAFAQRVHPTVERDRPGA